MKTKQHWIIALLLSDAKACNMPMSHLAKAAGLTQNAMYRWMSETYQPRVRSIEAAAAALDYELVLRDRRNGRIVRAPE